MIECLLVDDDGLVAETTKDFLELGNEIHVTVALSAREALGLLKEKKFDAIVSDYQMPVMDGIQFLKAVRRVEAETPFILFTGKGREEIVIQAFESGADFYVQKGGQPAAQFAELRHKLMAAVLRRAAEAAAREQRTRLEALIDVADRSIFSVDRSYRYTAFNARHRETMKEMYSADIELGRSILEYQSVPEDRARAKENLDQALGGRRHTAASFSGESGRHRFEIEVSHIPIRDAGGNVIGVAVYSERTADRTLMEAQLAESRRRYEAIFSAYNEGVALHEMIYDCEGKGVDYRIIDVNPAMERLLRMPKADMIGKLASELYGKSVGRYLEALALTAGTGRPTSFEMFLPHIAKHVLVSVSSPAKGQFATVFMDVTAQKDAEKAMRQNIEKYRSVTENAAEGLVVAQDGKIRFLNPAVTDMLQLGPGEGIGRDFAQFIHPEDVGLVLDRYRKRIAGEAVPPRYDFRVLGSKGKITWVSISAVIISWEGRPATLNFLVDITERKRAETALKKLERAVEHSPASIVITDANGSIEWANPKFTEVTGYTLEEAMGQNPRILKTGEMSREEYALLWNTISSGGTWKGEFHNRKKNGELYWEAASISPILDHEGKVANYIAIKEDITERKLLEEDLAQAGKKLAIMNSITRHDVLNSILIIEGSTALLAKNPQTAAANLDRIHRAAETIKQQMAFAKLYQDIGAQVPAWQSILLSVIKAKASLDNKGLDIRMIGKDYEVRADPMFEKVIFNLFDNAIRHAAGATRVVLSTHEERGTLVIEVEDDGAGISGEDREHLFERGYGKNTGYGLFLSREILGITGINIEERGEAGKGARFLISVPSLDWRTSK